MNPSSAQLRPTPFRPAALRATLACALALIMLGAVALALAPESNAAVGEFQTLAASPFDMTSVAVDPTTNLIYAQENSGTEYWSYDPRTNAWKELAPAPINSGNNGGATYLGGKVYTVYTGNSSELGVYDIAGNTWTTIPNPLGEGTANITTVGSEIYLVGEDAFVKYNPTTKTTTPLAEPPTFAQGRCKRGFEKWGGLQFYQGKIYGTQGDGCEGFAVYDIASNTWTELAPTPRVESKEATEEEEEENFGPTAGSALDPVTGTYYAYGTYGGHTFFRYDIASKTWSSVEIPLEVEDGGMAYVTLPGGLRGVYAIEGESGTGFVRYGTPEPSANLGISQAASASTAKIGGEVKYALTVTNGGPNEANATVTDTLPGNVSVVSATPSQGTCSAAATVTCGIGALAPGASATVTITVKATAAGAAANTATVAGDVADPVPANNTATASVTVEAPPAVCVSTRKVTIHWKTLRGVHLRKIVVAIGGKKYLSLGGKARKATVNLSGHGAGTFVVTITGTTGAGKKYVSKRTYHVCQGHLPGNESRQLFLLRKK